MEFAHVRPGDIVECDVRGYFFLARFEGLEDDEYLGERVHVTPLSADGTEDPPESNAINYFRIGKTEVRRKLKAKQIAAWDIPGGATARRAFAPRGARRLAT